MFCYSLNNDACKFSLSYLFVRVFLLFLRQQKSKFYLPVQINLMKYPLIIHLLIIICCNCTAQDTLRPSTRCIVNDSTEIIFERPKVYSFITNIPADWYEFGKRTVSRQGLINVSALAVSTALMVLIDRPALNGVQHFGNYIGVMANENLQRL